MLGAVVWKSAAKNNEKLVHQKYATLMPFRYLMLMFQKLKTLAFFIEKSAALSQTWIWIGILCKYCKNWKGLDFLLKSHQVMVGDSFQAW